MAYDPLANIFGEDEEDKLVTRAPSNASSSRTATADPLGDIFGTSGKTQKQQQVEQVVTPQTVKKQEGSGFFDKALFVVSKIGDGISKALDKATNPFKMPGSPMAFLDNPAINLGAQIANTVTKKTTGVDLKLNEKLKVAQDAPQKAMEYPAIQFFNSSAGKKVTGTIADKSSNVPLKVWSAFKAIGDETYDEVYSAARKDADENGITLGVFEKGGRAARIVDGLQDSGVQSAMGVLLALGVSAASRGRIKPQIITTPYFAAISAEGQRKERGEVTSIGNIAIDTIGDNLISGVAEKALVSLVKEGGESAVKEFLKKTGKGFLVEGGTEPTQTFLKYVNDYRNAKTEEEKQAIVAKVTQYVKEGGMVDEFLIGGISGAGMTAAATGVGTALGVKPETDVSSVQLDDKEAGGGTRREAMGELNVDFAKVRDEVAATQAELSQTENPSDETVMRLTELQDQLNDYQQAFKDRPVFVSTDEQENPLASIETVEYPDGKFAVSFAAATPSNSIASPFTNDTYATKEEALEAGRQAVREWAQQRLLAGDEVEAPVLREIIKDLDAPQNLEAKTEKPAQEQREKKQSDSAAVRKVPGGYALSQFNQKGENGGRREVRFKRSKVNGKVFVEVYDKGGERIERMPIEKAQKRYGTKNRQQLAALLVNGVKDKKTGKWELRQSNKPVIRNTSQQQVENKPVVVRGEVKKSKAFDRVRERLGEYADTDVNYNRLNLVNDTANALDFIEKNPADAKKIALGLMGAPEGVTETAISIALAEKAAEDKDYALQARLERSRSLRQTRRGQEIVAERGRFNENSPHFFFQQLLAARMERVGGRNFKAIFRKGSGEGRAARTTARIQEGTEALKRTVKTKLSAAQLAQKVIDDLTC